VRRSTLIAAAISIGLAAMLATSAAGAPRIPKAIAEAPAEGVHVIVTGAPGASAAVAAAISENGGYVLHSLPVINGVDAVVRASELGSLRAAHAVKSVTADAQVRLNSTPPDPTKWSGASPYNPKSYAGSLYNVAREVNADDLWNAGYSGKGIGVALIDSGVAPVPDIAANLVTGPDLSLDATGAATDGIDAFGHGTHMAGIIAGKDAAAGTDPKRYPGLQPTVFLGVAPDARLINLTVAAYDGSVEVSQVIAGIDWVV
jgi:serine protease AprX